MKSYLKRKSMVEDAEDSLFKSSKQPCFVLEPTKDHHDEGKDHSIVNPSQPTSILQPERRTLPTLSTVSMDPEPPRSSKSPSFIESFHGNKEEVSVHLPQAKYLHGEFKLTYSKYATDLQNTKHIRFNDIVQKEGLQNAILSSYVWEDEWLFQFLPKNLNLILIRSDMKTMNVGTCQIISPKLSGFGCMHVKLLLLNYGTFLRVVIPSANLYEFDWTGIQNVVFIQDFVSLSHERSSVDHGFFSHLTSVPTHGFFKHLETCLWDLGLQPFHTRFLHSFDDRGFQGDLIFSKPITSPFQPHGGSPPHGKDYGLAQLTHLVKSKFKWSSNDLLNIEITTSSLGSLNETYLHFFLECLVGEKLSPQQAQKSSLKIGFPTMDTVLKSRDSLMSRQSIFLSAPLAEKLPKGYLARLESKVEGGLLHAKTILVYRKEPLEETSSRPLGFYYAGSHNFSKAAWGWLTSKGQLTMRNYELGVVFPITSMTDLDTVYPISYKRPMALYRPGMDQPWHA